MESENLARTIAQRQVQIEQLSIQLLEYLNKITALEATLKSLQIEKHDLLKKLEKKSDLIKQETTDIEILKTKIQAFEKKTWGDTFAGFRSWINDKLPTGLHNPNLTRK